MLILRVRLGEALGGMGKYSEATEQLNAALKIDPKHIGAYLDLGLVAVAAKNPTAAESYFKKVVELTESSQYSAAQPVARDRALQSRPAGTWTRSATTMRPVSSRRRSSSARTPRTRTTSSRRRCRGWARSMAPSSSSRSASSSTPDFAEAHYFLGQLYKQKKDDVNASYQFVRAAELAPEADPPREALEAYGPPAPGWRRRVPVLLAAM